MQKNHWLGTMTSIVELNISVDKNNLNEHVYSILETVRPGWKTSDIKITDLPGGILNFVYSVSSSSHPDDVIVLKVFNEASAALMDHARDYVLTKFLTQKHPDVVQLYCKFQNGYMYKYIPGRMITLSDVRDDSFTRKMFEKVHQLHAVPLPPHMERDAQNFDGARVMLEKSISLLQSEKTATLDKDVRVSSAGISRKILLEMAEETLNDFKLQKKNQPNVLKNGDLRMHNIIVDEQADEVHLIDWDTIGVGVELTDLAIILSRDILSLKERANLLPYQNEAFMDKRLMMYLETHPQYQGKTVNGDVFGKWKQMLLQTIVATVKGQVAVYFAMGVQYAFANIKYDWIPWAIKSYEASLKYKAMLQKYMDAENCSTP